jgi:integrase
MAKKPRKKHDKWPYVFKDGKTKSYQLSFYDHDGVERSKSFPKATGIGGAKEWADAYVQAERLGKDSLRRFLLDLDAAEADAENSGRVVAQIIQLYLAHVAHWQVGGLAPPTFYSYKGMANRHLLGKEGKSPTGETTPALKHSLEVANRPARDFNSPAAPRAWRTAMERAHVPGPTIDRAWKVLSSALTWAAKAEDVPEIETNGCILATVRRGGQRRSQRRGGTGEGSGRSRQRRRGAAVRAWALSPKAVELIRVQQLRRVNQRDALLPLRDALITTLQYGLCLRDQEVYGLRWRCCDATELDDPELVVVDEVLTWNQLDEGKTSGSARETHCPSLLREELTRWKVALRKAGHGTRDVDFVIPGDLGGEGIGILDPLTGARHYSSNMAKKFGPKYFAPAVRAVAENDSKYADLLGATPYALRRGGISLRLRTEDAQIVADSCGTSLAMLDKHYAFALKDLDRLRRLPMDEEWRLARAEVEAEHGSGPYLRIVA